VVQDSVLGSCTFGRRVDVYLQWPQYNKVMAEKYSVGRRWASSSCVITTIHGASYRGIDTEGEADPITSVNMSQALSKTSEELHFTSL